MATRPATIEHLLDRATGCDLAARKMFGEYGLYAGGTFVGVVCDDTLYLKPTAPGRALAATAPLAPPYPGAKPHLQIDAESWDDTEALTALIRATAAALPAARSPKRGKA